MYRRQCVGMLTPFANIAVQQLFIFSSAFDFRLRRTPPFWERWPLSCKLSLAGMHRGFLVDKSQPSTTFVMPWWSWLYLC